LVQRARGNDNDSTRFDLAPFIYDGDRDAALDGECDFDVRMRWRRRPYSRLQIKSLAFADGYGW